MNKISVLMREETISLVLFTLERHKVSLHQILNLLCLELGLHSPQNCEKQTFVI